MRAAGSWCATSHIENCVRRRRTTWCKSDPVSTTCRFNRWLCSMLTLLQHNQLVSCIDPLPYCDDGGSTVFYSILIIASHSPQHHVTSIYEREYFSENDIVYSLCRVFCCYAHTGPRFISRPFRAKMSRQRYSDSWLARACWRGIITRRIGLTILTSRWTREARLTAVASQYRMLTTTSKWYSRSVLLCYGFCARFADNVSIKITGYLS